MCYSICIPYPARARIQHGRSASLRARHRRQHRRRMAVPAGRRGARSQLQRHGELPERGRAAAGGGRRRARQRRRQRARAAHGMHLTLWRALRRWCCVVCMSCEACVRSLQRRGVLQGSIAQPRVG